MIATLKNYLKKIPFLFYLVKWIYLAIVAVVASFKWSALQKQPNIKLELGSGVKRGKNGWTTVDLRGADINYNLRGGLPLKDESVDAIYTSHMLEHIPYKGLMILLKECHRVLKKGGSLSVCVPNAKLYIQAYLEGREFEDRSKMYQEALPETGSLLDQVNYIAYMDDGHTYLFDEENLVNTLKKGGFNNVQLRKFDADLDSTKYDYVSIYAIAAKE